jgi:hypothetical protein
VEDKDTCELHCALLLSLYRRKSVALWVLLATGIRS